MPPRYLRKTSPTRLKHCQERTFEACDNEPTDGCCGVVPCRLCLEWETYEDGIQHGSADFGTSSWTGTVGGAAFVAYWEREILPDIIPPVSNNSIGMGFSKIEAGTYTMGSPAGETGRDADEDEISTAVAEFAISVREVTQENYQAVRGTNPSFFTTSGEDRPVEKVSYTDAQAFCVALSARPAEIAAGRTYRLPTEAEWEFACRKTTTTAYSFGADDTNIGTYAWTAANSGDETHDVALKTPNDNQLHDMHGNVWEWVINSRTGSEGYECIRGGAYNSPSEDCRSASREMVLGSTKEPWIGFRVVMVQSPIPQVGECEFVVTFDGDEVYRATCYEGASCRNPAGEVSASIGYDEGTLRWSVYEPRELALIDDPETGCRDFFCGACRCTCDCLCVTITSPYGITDRGELCSSAYECDPPLWIGSVGGYSLEIALGRNQYGECIITPTVDGIELDAVSVVGCDDLAATFTLEDGSVVVVRCKQCSCEEGDCVVGCCWPITYDNPLYPGGALADIPFDLDGCAAATLSGTFRPFEPGTLDSGRCGPCGNYRGDWTGVVVGILKIESGASCMDTPCSVSICLLLECVTDNESNGLEECCSHIRLWVGASEPLVGADPDGPPAELVIGGCDSWLKIAPTTCLCGGESGLSAVFNISLALVRETYASGPCAGQPIGCQIACQTLTLTI